MANTVAEITRLTFILKDLRIPLASSPIFYRDNLIELYIYDN
jgi:hypothetical protein